MESHFLTNKVKVRGLIFDFLEEKFSTHTRQGPKLEKSFEFIRHYNDHADPKFSNWVGLYRRDGKEYVVKYLQFTFKNLKYYQLRHEAEILQALAHVEHSNSKKLHVHFPKLHSLVEKQNSITLIREHMDGEFINELSAEQKTNILDVYIKDMKSIDVSAIDPSVRIPRMNTNHYAVLFFVYLIKALVKDLRNIRLYLALFFQFYKNLAMKSSYHSKVCLAHRDLHENNFVVTKKSINIIDLEVCAFADEETDLAIIARYYLKSIGINKVIELIKNNLLTKKQFYNFTCLSIFYGIQLIANEQVNDFYSIQSKEYLKTLLNNIIPFV